MDENISHKAAALIQRQMKRDQENGSILDALGLEVDSPTLEMADVESVDISNPPPKCAMCNGAKVVRAIFSKWECSACFGTGFDLSNPIAVIKWQNACLDWSKGEITGLRQKNRELADTRTKEEKESDAIDKFYANTKIKD
ncbi:hypothetical protein [Vibrio fluvialis]|uniref:hypothetical protein n=2 Tax=Vibrio fluvialis TaxID=676 RepID=UPI001EEBEC64|nr:hypothetical protein [Vibrio fluvialis]MCG6387468.1 hypothetical protein [Vibrio fluvialis]